MQPDFPTKGHHFVFRPVIALQSPLAHGTEPADKDLQCLEQSRGRVLRLGSIQGTDEGKGKQLMSQWQPCFSELSNMQGFRTDFPPKKPKQLQIECNWRGQNNTDLHQAEGIQ